MHIEGRTRLSLFDFKIFIISDIYMEQSNYRPLILVAEDDESNIKLIKAVIGKKTEVLWANNGLKAIELYNERKADIELILMDIKMPEKNGLEATKEIREQDALIPIIVQTAYAFASDRQKSMDAGASDVLVKPIMSSLFKKTISKYLPNIVWK